jgi:hypothetical protein
MIRLNCILHKTAIFGTFHYSGVKSPFPFSVGVFVEISLVSSSFTWHKTGSNPTNLLVPLIITVTVLFCNIVFISDPWFLNFVCCSEAPCGYATMSAAQAYGYSTAGRWKLCTRFHFSLWGFAFSKRQLRNSQAFEIPLYKPWDFLWGDGWNYSLGLVCDNFQLILVPWNILKWRTDSQED